MNNLIIIGNGFDLEHGLKTSYNHFIEHMVNSHCKDRECYKDLFQLPTHTKDFDHLKKIRRTSPTILGESTFKNELIKSLISDVSLNNWCDIEEKYFQLLNANTKQTPYFQNPKQLNDDFKILKKHLEEYLIEQEKEAKPIESYQEFFSNIDAPGTLILNFNYTHTIEKLYQKEIGNSKIIHIHGELGNENNPIIFGYAASHEESRDLSGKNDKEYLRNIKKQLYKRTDNEHQLSNFLNIHKNIYLSILGHSCGFSDKLILKQILNHKNIHDKDRSIRIFYYKEYEYYFETQVNIDRIMDDDERFRALLVDFSNSDMIPQFNNDSHPTKLIELVTKVKEQEQNSTYNTKADLGIF